MSFQIDQATGDIVINGWEQGIAPSPHKGVANIQNANIATETKEVMASFVRFQQSQVNITGTGSLAFSSTNQLSYSLFGFSLSAGLWITVSGSSNTGELANQNFYVRSSASGIIQISNDYGSAVISGFTAGLTASFTITDNFNSSATPPIASATEPYSNGAQQYRYYILDGQGLVWVYDTATASPSTGLTWFLPDYNAGYYTGSAPSGIGVLDGWLFVIGGLSIYCKPTVNLGGNTNQNSTWSALYDSSGNPGMLMSLENTNNSHFAFVGHQGKLYYCDGCYLGMIFPDTSTIVTGLPNIQSFCSYAAITTTATVSTVISGSIPKDPNPISTELRVPAVFFAAQGGTIPNSMSAATVYYIQYTNNTTFEVFANQSGGSALNIASGANGIQYFNTFWPIAMAANQPITFTFEPQILNLPSFEIGQCMCEIGNQIFVGCAGNTIYPWSQIAATPDTLITLPESNVAQMINANNMAYIFAGNKGNIYITNGSVASLVTTVPDYCAGVPGTPTTYIEPYFVWGGAMYLRGRIYFSIADQTATKNGNCGGIWSFIPTQNFYVGQDIGIGLRLENENSYGTYSGYATVLVPNQNQASIAPQFWSAWQSRIGFTGYGIDATGTFPSGTTVIETDMIPTGTMLEKKTFRQQEYKVSSPLLSGESIQLFYRTNLTAAWTSCGTVNTETSPLSGYFSATFEKTQWLQLQAVLTTNGTSTFSGNRMTEIRVR